MMLAEAVAEFEGRFRVVDGPSCAYAPTGEKYVAVCSGGIKAEGEPTALYNSADEAIAAWRHSFADYAEDKSGVLYWREEPTLETETGEYDPVIGDVPYDRDKYYVYSRLVISDKPLLSWQQWHNEIGLSSHPVLTPDEWDRRYMAVRA